MLWIIGAVVTILTVLLIATAVLFTGAVIYEILHKDKDVEQ